MRQRRQRRGSQGDCPGTQCQGRRLASTLPALIAAARSLNAVNGAETASSCSRWTSVARWLLSEPVLVLRVLRAERLFGVGTSSFGRVPVSRFSATGAWLPVRASTSRNSSSTPKLRTRTVFLIPGLEPTVFGGRERTAVPWPPRSTRSIRVSRSCGQSFSRRGWCPIRQHNDGRSLVATHRACSTKPWPMT
jgi:hypothetical protein